ncbi:MAG TPA: HlyD family efflux transporter periplasmic adaptor subunit, partial [Gemmatimonadales bacterium]
MKRRLIVLVPLVLAALSVLAWRSGFARDEVPHQITASGTVEATEAQLGFQAAGRIDALAAREGDAVRLGTELASLDRAEMLARREQAVAQAAAARAQLLELEHGARSEEVAQAAAVRDAARERVRDTERDFARTMQLFEGGAASREQLDKATTALDVARTQERHATEQLALVRTGPRPERIEAARATVAQAEATVATIDAQLANMVVRAPFDGVVTVRHREAGEVVPAGSPVLTIMNPDDRWVRIYVPENRLAAVRLGMPATISS